ncbi:hypothetical protein MLD38_017563 [Melastoma candidum]|uniref:Uncharacterized protein n=1 Tax=Melastoma candidum TaxID=119954 RepID=A0ACB9QR73_9MYRT|nr:hypothetical protein MLD38_017563 [Melastoma candidum]
METEVEIKASADEFYQVFRNRPHHLPNICSDITSGKVSDGQWQTHGSTRHWDYQFGGKTEIFKEKISFDDANRKVNHIGVAGDPLKRYKVFNGSWEAIPKAGGVGAIVKVVIEYQKLSKDIPSPDDYLELLVGFTTDIDAHLSKA